jgi:hypothetical protein
MTDREREAADRLAEAADEAAWQLGIIAAATLSEPALRAATKLVGAARAYRAARSKGGNDGG